MITFTTTLYSGGGNTTGIIVPEEIWHELTPARRAAVVATVAGHSYPSMIGWYRGAFMLPVSAEIRGITGLAAGDPVEVSVDLDTAPRIIEAPEDLKAAIASDAAAQAAWDTLSPSGRKAHVTAVEGAKTEETRQRRIVKAVDTLAGR